MFVEARTKMDKITVRVMYSSLASSGGGLKRKSSIFLIRCGVQLVAFLALFVVLTLLKQFGEVRDFGGNEVSVPQGGSSIMEYKKVSAIRRRIKKKVVYSDTSGYFHDKTEVLFDGFSKTDPENNQDFATEDVLTDLTGKLKHRVQETIYKTRRTFFESRQNLHETALDSKEDSSELEDSSLPRRARRVPAHVAGAPRVSRGTRASVMILAYYRSGSSFLGQMFNQNPRVFYLFEPLHPIHAFLGARLWSPLLYDTMVRHLLDTIFECAFLKHPFFVNTLSTSPFRLKSQVLSTPGFCDPRATSRKMHLCRRINATVLTRLCRSRSHTVIKALRVRNWEDVDSLEERGLAAGPTLDLKVLHLVRDPRAILASRVWKFLAASGSGNTTGHANGTGHAMLKHIRTSSASLCVKMRREIFDGKKRTARGKTYSLVRYEDIAQSPMGAYKQISDFTGIARSDHVTKWLERNTKSNSDPYYYSTSRNSSAAAHMWRLRLPMSLVMEIQKQCDEVMRILGYRLVYNDAELRDTSTSLVVEWDNGELLRTNVAV